MNRFTSQKFRFYTFACIVLLLWVHGYNLNETYLSPYSLVKEKLTITTFTEYVLSNCLLRFRIPMLFIISGYIYAFQDRVPYWARIKKRIKGLVVPYFVWSAAGLAITYLLQQYPATAAALQAAQLDQLGDNRPYTAIGWHGIIWRWVAYPISFQLWFIRSLFIYNLLYPVLKKLVLNYPKIWFSVLLILWVNLFHFFYVEAQSLLFFTAGIWLYNTDFPINKKPVWLSTTLCWLIYIAVALVKTFMAFEFENYAPPQAFLFSLLHMITAVSGILAVWFSGDAVVKNMMDRRWFVSLTAFSFIIYAMHVPLLPYLTRLLYQYSPTFTNYRLLTYVIAPFISLVICVAAGATLRKLVPGLYKVITGGRGF